MNGITAYGAYLPRHRLSGTRVVASYDEDSTTMGVEAARWLPAAEAVYLATTSPAYFDKTNAAAIHAALGLGPEGFAADLAGSGRSAIAAFRAAAATGGLAVLSDVRTGSNDGDGAAAFLFGAPEIAEVIAEASTTGEFLDRWRAPGEARTSTWEERFGFEAYMPLVTAAAEQALKRAGLSETDHVVVSAANPLVAKRYPGHVPAALGYSGAADVGLRLADILDRAAPGETILLLSAVDGCDALVLRATGKRRAAAPSTEGREVSYETYLTWRGLLERETPRRPEPDRAAAPPSHRSAAWKFAFTGSRCEGCGLVHLPPARVCKDCGAVDRMAGHPLADTLGTVVTFTVDRLAYSPSPPLIDVVVDFDGGGRCTLELADAGPDEVAVGMRVEPTFRKLSSTGGVHNYFWKVRPHG